MILPLLLLLLTHFLHSAAASAAMATLQPGLIDGKEITPYVGPQPPVGIHRYILMLFRQKSPLGVVEHPTSQANFNTRCFATQHGLGLPVATVYFNAQKESTNRRR